MNPEQVTKLSSNDRQEFFKNNKNTQTLYNIYIYNIAFVNSER